MNSGSEDANIAEALRGIMDKVLSDIYIYIYIGIYVISICQCKNLDVKDREN